MYEDRVRHEIVSTEYQKQYFYSGKNIISGTKDSEGVIQEYNSLGLITHYKSPDYEYWKTYDSKGRLLSLKYGNGVKEEYSYNDYDDLGIGKSSDKDYEYEFIKDENGNELYHSGLNKKGYTIWREYDSHGNITMEIKWPNYSVFVRKDYARYNYYVYEYYPNGTMKSKKFYYMEVMN